MWLKVHLALWKEKQYVGERLGSQLFDGGGCITFSSRRWWCYRCSWIGHPPLNEFHVILAQCTIFSPTREQGEAKNPITLRWGGRRRVWNSSANAALWGWTEQKLWATRTSIKFFFVVDFNEPLHLWQTWSIGYRPVQLERSTRVGISATSKFEYWPMCKEMSWFFLLFGGGCQGGGAWASDCQLNEGRADRFVQWGRRRDSGCPRWSGYRSARSGWTWGDLATRVAGALAK